ncbi:ribbon-helix-helix domain-containing protein [Anabaena azotica]|uniref:ribbon-helix-helix domain-containing protein n=1 Tax=Anabaena azotica TaxID=197653 RepID=UPI0039A5348D
MIKKTNLADSLKKASEPEKVITAKTSQPEQPQPEAKSEVPPSRVGKKAIAGHFDPAVGKQLRQLALDNDTTVQALLEEALNDLFLKYGKSPIA